MLSNAKCDVLLLALKKKLESHFRIGEMVNEAIAHIEILFIQEGRLHLEHAKTF